MKRTFLYLVTTLSLSILFSCGSDKQPDTPTINSPEKSQNDTLTKGTALVKTPIELQVPNDPIVLKVSFNEDDSPINDYLTEQLKPIRNNFKRINSVNEWSLVDKRKLELLPNNGAAEYYYYNGSLEKIIARYPTSGSKEITEYYLLTGQLSFVIEKSILQPDQSETGSSELITDKNYFKNNKLIHKIHSQDCGAPFADDYLIEEQKRIIGNFKGITGRLNK